MRGACCCKAALHWGLWLREILKVVPKQMCGRCGKGHGNTWRVMGGACTCMAALHWGLWLRNIMANDSKVGMLIGHQCTHQHAAILYIIYIYNLHNMV